MGTGGKPTTVELADLIPVAVELVGATLPVDVAPHVQVATIDTIRAFAHSIGDDNPLFGDEDHAAGSGRGRLVAPPLFAMATGAPGGQPSTEAVRLMAGLKTQGAEVVDDQWSFLVPVGAGTRLVRHDRLTSAQPEPAGTLLTVLGSQYAADGVTYAERRRTVRYGTTLARGPADRRPVQTYDDDQIAAIDDQYRDERRTGPRSFTVAELAVGTDLPPRVKGPMTITDLVALRAGVGAGPYGAGPLRLAYLNRQQRPGFYDRTPWGGFDARERLHWDEDYARAKGHPTVYDYSYTRLLWAGHLLTDWVGDDGRVTDLQFRIHAHNYVGDTHWMEGRIESVDLNAAADLNAGADRNPAAEAADQAEVRPGPGWARVTVALRGRNQLDHVTCDGRATVTVPVAGA